MRLLLYAPLLGLLPVAVLAQTTSGGHNYINLQHTTGWMREPVIAPGPEMTPTLTCDLCQNATMPQRVTARPAVMRAIRAIGSRIFPANRFIAPQESAARRAFTGREPQPVLRFYVWAR